VINNVRANRLTAAGIDLAFALVLPPSQSTGLVVLGMHRSGTSAMSGILHIMGVPVGAEEDLMPADDANQKGYWESRRLTDFQELLLREQGGSWDSPPSLPTGWERRPGLLLTRGRARRVFRRVYGSRPLWAWKDPRTSLTLPFWKRTLRSRILAIVIHRNPLEVARSLADRDGMGTERAVSLWETYNRSLLETAAGLPAFVASYESLVGDPSRVAFALQRFLIANRIPVTAVPQDEVRSFVDGQLRHSAFDAKDLDHHPSITDSQRELARRLIQLDGAHHALTP
jgi:hypothetical protein